MDNSVRTCAILIFKLHSAIIEAIKPNMNITVYPVMDGVYITSTSRSDIESFLIELFTLLASLFLGTPKMQHRFVIKASIAYGPIVHGKDVQREANIEFDNRPEYKNSILLGMPMIQAYSSEQCAPPFGIYIHESARSFAPSNSLPFSFKWWKWFMQPIIKWDNEKHNNFVLEMNKYYDYSLKNSNSIDYSKDRVEAHKSMFNEYYSIDQQE